MAPSTVPPRILLVDDDYALCYVIERSLQLEGYTVDSASRGDEAAQLIHANRYDAVISDIDMPGMSGIELLHAVRQIDFDLPVILITGVPLLETAIQAVEHGAFRYLTKPVSPQVVSAVVRYAVDIHRLARVKREAMALVGHNAYGAADRAGLAASLDRALDAMWLTFQPIVSWKHQRVFAHEVLMRSEEEALPHPRAIFEAAETLHRVQDVGRRVRELTAQALLALPEDQTVFVNLHPHDLLDATLFAAHMPLVKQAHRVILELTERASLDGLGDIQDRVGRLRQLGFRLAVDDLGAGYAGLQTFVQVKPDLAKLDGSLVRHIDRDPTRQQLVRSMLELCDALNTSCVVEGVEEAGELQTLIGMGADLLQGYLFARPSTVFVQLTAEEIRRAAA